MPPIPKRHTLASQTAEILRAEIARGAWADLLPGERVLCEKLQISRNTLRTALGQLRDERILRAEHGTGHRILSRSNRAVSRARSRDVALLTAQPLERLRPSHTLWIDELRGMLGEHDCRLHLFHGAACFRSRPGPALRQLLARHPHGCWILMQSNAGTQRWFSEHAPQCIVAGSVHPGFPLAFRDLDHRAICRHAAGVLLGLGHHRMALMVSNPPKAGDLESEAGWTEAVIQSRHPEAEALLAPHNGTVGGIAQALHRVFGLKRPPTALVVANPYHYLTVTSHLARMGLRVPRDVSVISRDDDLFLSYVVPEPSRYTARPHAMAKALLRPVLELLAGGQPAQPALMLMPDFHRGGSIGARKAE